MFLKEIRLQTKKLSVLYNFYKDVLELPVKYNDEKKIEVGAGESKLVFEETYADINPFYHFAFNIPSNKVEESFQWLQNKVELLWLDDYKSFIADFVNWHAKSIYFTDSAGNILELIARFDLKDEEVEPFSSKQIRNISEIGLVLPKEKFDISANDILNKYQLSYFPKQPPLPHFRAVGDDEGLFIMVPENRNWFATKMPSAIFPVEIVFMNNYKLLHFKSGSYPQ